MLSYSITRISSAWNLLIKIQGLVDFIDLHSSYPYFYTAFLGPWKLSKCRGKHVQAEGPLNSSHEQHKAQPVSGSNVNVAIVNDVFGAH